MIEVGEYVRSKEGLIIKVDWVGQSIVTDKEDKITISKQDIVKHSKNIIDLIEVGDIVNITFWHEPDDFETFIYNIKNIYDFKNEIENEVITLNSIVTKEMMKSVEYRIN